MSVYILKSWGPFFKQIIEFYRLEAYVPVCTVIDKNKYKALFLIGNWPSFQKWYKIFSYPYIHDYNSIKLKSQKLNYFFKKLAPDCTGASNGVFHVLLCCILFENETVECQRPN